MKISDLETFIMTDQPTTCGQCGSRTEFLRVNVATQLHVCLKPGCREVFLVEEDDDADS